MGSFVQKEKRKRAVCSRKVSLQINGLLREGENIEKKVAVDDQITASLKASGGSPAPSKTYQKEYLMSKRAVAKADTPAALPATDFSKYAGVGTENITPDDILVPRLVILQALSPQVDESDGAYVPGAKQGMILDVGTGQLFPEGVTFLPCYFRTDFLEWAPRNSGRGLVAVHPSADILNHTTRDEKNKDVLPNGNYVARTSQFFGFNLSAENQKCFIPMASTQLKRARAWNTLITSERRQRPNGTSFQPAIFLRTYHLTTVKESNADGTWFSWKIERGPTVEEWCEKFGMDAEALADQAFAFHQQMLSGDVKVAHGSDEEGAAASADDEGAF